MRHPSLGSICRSSSKQDILSESLQIPNERELGYKLGSVQSYVRSECSADDMGPQKFDKGDVQRIASLDIRMCNLDRHPGNILVATANPYQSMCITNDFIDRGSPRVGSSCAVRKSSNLVAFSAPAGPSFSPMQHFTMASNDATRLSFSTNSGESPVFTDIPLQRTDSFPPASPSQYRLVPIDHGYCLPHVLQMSDPNFTWMSWPAAREALLPEIKAYIGQLDVEADCVRLRDYVGSALPETSLLTLRVCTMFLQAAVASGLTLYDIGTCMIAIPELHGLSKLQCAVNVAIQRTINYGIGSHARSANHNHISPRSILQLKRGTSWSSGGRFSLAMSNGQAVGPVEVDCGLSELEIEEAYAQYAPYINIATSTASIFSDLFVSDDMLECALAIRQGKSLLREVRRAIHALVFASSKK